MRNKNNSSKVGSISNFYSNVVQNSNQQITGSVERITFYNPDNHYCIIKIAIDKQKGLVTVVGNASAIAVGQQIEAQGMWIENKIYGHQFKAAVINILPPNTVEGIEKYLGSGLIKGIGAVYAKKLIQKFGPNILRIIEEEPSKLGQVPGIGKKKIEQIVVAWQEQKSIREIMLFSHENEIPASKAVRIFKNYGTNAIAIIEQNPYRLAVEIHGIGFKTADKIAAKVGISLDSPLRIESAIYYCLNKSFEAGACAVPYLKLASICTELLGLDEQQVLTIIAQNLVDKKITLYSVGGVECIFANKIFDMETTIAQKLIQLRDSPLPWPEINAAKAIEKVQKALNIELSATQKVAVAEGLTSKLLVITGGPGVGKTTIVNSILKILQAENVRVNLAAPTGRAAKRMCETTGYEAKTLHRLLQQQFENNYTDNFGATLNCDLLIIDETSMVDIPLMHLLLRSLPLSAGLFLVGDIDQLPSVGPGTLLRDVIESESTNVIRLTEIFRQASQSQIVTNAYRINQGVMPIMTQEKASEFVFVPTKSAEETITKTIALMLEYYQYMNMPLKDIQILCPMNKGAVGTRAFNLEIQKVFNFEGHKIITVLGSQFRKGDKVMQIENNYDKDVYNGDIGIIDVIIEETKEIVINFDGKMVAYEFSQLDQITLAYAVTIHKSQGSEYQTVIVPILMEQYIMLQRNLLYTAITRGKKMVILVGQKEAVEIAVGKTTKMNRYSSLKSKLNYFGNT